MTMHSSNAFETLAALGYRRLVPIIPPTAPISERSSLFKRVGTSQDGRGKTPGIRGRDGNWFGFDWIPYEADEQDLQRWHRMGAGVGIKTGDGLVAIDADTTDPAHAATIRATIAEVLGELPIRIGQPPKALYPVRVATAFPYGRVEFGPPRETGAGRIWRVEILSEGRQFVASGIHPKTREPYRWERPLLPLEQLPIATPQQLVRILDLLRERLPDTSEIVREGSTATVSQASLAGKLETVRRAVEATPNTSAHFPSRERYRDYGYAIKAALPDDEPEAFGLFADWCARWDDGSNDPEIVAADWRRMKGPFRRGASWLYELASEIGNGFSAADPWFEDLDAPANPFEAVAREQSRAAEDAAPARAPLAFTPFDEAADSALAIAAKPLIKGLLDQCAMTVLYGASNTGKTFVAMDMAFHIATDRAWGGMKTAPGFHVVYVAAEGGAGARKRAAALRRKYGSDGGRFHFLLAPVNLLKPDADLRPLIEAVRSLGVLVGLIVVDTFSRAMAGGDENSSTDMGAMVMHLDLLRKATNAHLLAVHHSGKDAMKGARGWSGLRAATDTEIEIADGAITVTKQRDLDREWSSAFVLEVVELGIDGDGDPVTSCTVRLVREDDRPPETATRKEEAIIRAVREITAERAGTDDEGASIADVVAYLGGDTDKAATNSVRFHLLAAHRKQLIRRVGRGRYAVTAFSLLNARKTLPSNRKGHNVNEAMLGECEEAETDIFA